MTRRSWLPGAVTVVVGILAAGCGSSLKILPPAVSPPAAATIALPEPAAPPPEDPITVLIATSQRHFTAGEPELKVGHLEQAKVKFNLALEVLLQSPYGARSEPRIREHFDRLVDRISAYEISALAKGDGFAERQHEPASIDELRALSLFDQPAPTAELQATVQTDLENTSHDVAIPLNEKVLSYIELFKTRLHDWLEEGMRRGSRYLPMIQDVFRAEGLPLDLAYVPLIESAFNPNALSRAKAKGLWQFMRGTALENGLKHDWYIDERADPEKATLAAANYLKMLRGLFEGDWHLALASYNGGPGRLQRAIARSREADFWALAKNPRYLPRETREYVPMILAAVVIAKNPVQYGFNFESEPPVAYEKVAVPEPVDLRRVAEWASVSIDEIQSLNPELRRWTTPVRYPNYAVKVPAGTAEVFRVRLAAAHEAELTALQWHTVKRGESLVTIARKLKVKQSDLAEANYLSTRARVAPGRKLIIPRAPTTLLAARTDQPAPEPVVAASRAVVPRHALLARAPTGEPPPREKRIYRVKRGDTLFAIARLYDTTVESLKSWNAKIRGTRINPGDRLTIFATRLAN